VLAGRWWGSGAAREFSVETELAALLGIRLGDRLRFQVLDQDLEDTATSLRSVAWESSAWLKRMDGCSAFACVLPDKSNEVTFDALTVVREIGWRH
jgi:hypothetical protein